MQTPETMRLQPILLLDETVIEQAEFCRQTFHAPVKDAANPIIVQTEAWEGHGPYTWGTRLLWNPDTRQYDFYYVCYGLGGDNHYRWGLAVSDDGLSWTKPKLDIETFDDKPAQNQLTAGPHAHNATRTVVRDPRPDCPPAERYKAIRYTRDGAFASHSADGRRWTEYPDNPYWRVPSDIMHAMWDPQRERFVVYYKIWKVMGETPDPGAPGGFRPVTRYFNKFKRIGRDDGLTELRGQERIFHPEAVAETHDEVTLLLRTGDVSANDGGGGQLGGAWHSERVIGWAESDDFLHWRHERIVMECDDRDRPDANIQYAFVMWYGGYYLGFLTLHDERGHFEQELALSRDGLTWSRPWRGNFIGLGSPDAFDCGMVLAPTDPILTETQMIFYYGGFKYLHHKMRDRDALWPAAIGRAVLRRDGFASWDSLPGHTGLLTMRPIPVTGETLWVNADAGGGQLTVEVLNEQGAVIPGFEAESCQPLREDTNRFSDCLAPVRWESGATLEKLQGRPVRLRFYLREAKLFSVSFRDQQR